MAALFALILGLFATGPLVDALTCGQESSASCEATLVSGEHSDADQSHGKDVLHGCAHGHCHASPNLPPMSGGTDMFAAASAFTSFPGDPLLRSTAPDGLIRPPRA